MKPFAPDPLFQGIHLEARARRQSGLLELSYHLHGDLSRLRVPPETHPVRRLDELWKQTCFEAFLSPVGETAYWEVNLSPSRDWNVYRFNDYRQGMATEARLSAFPCQVMRLTPHELSLTAHLDLALLGLIRTPIRVGLSAVLQSTQGKFQYWALRHDGSAPDFHLASSFELEL